MFLIDYSHGLCYYFFRVNLHCCLLSSAVEQPAVNRLVEGSIPSVGAMARWRSGLTHYPFTVAFKGSNPLRVTNVTLNTPKGVFFIFFLVIIFIECYDFFMKAIIQRQYGDETTLQMVNLTEPMINRGHEIKIKVHVANITSGDRNINTLALHPLVKFIMQIIFGFGKPRARIRGISGAGEVVEIGKAVTRFKVGDHVNFINSFGASVMAEFLILKDSQVIAKIAKKLSYIDAAPLPFGAMTAYHFLNEKTLKPNQKVLIYGASGSVGTAAVTLAKYFKTTVTAVASKKHHAALQTLSPDYIVDYQTDDFSKLQGNFDVVFDAVGKMLPVDQKRLKNKKGLFYSVKSITKESTTRLQTLNDLLASGNLQLINHPPFKFADFQKAHQHVYTGHQTGNTTLLISSDSLKS